MRRYLTCACHSPSWHMIAERHLCRPHHPLARERLEQRQSVAIRLDGIDQLVGRCQADVVGEIEIRCQLSASFVRCANNGKGVDHLLAYGPYHGSLVVLAKGVL